MALINHSGQRRTTADAAPTRPEPSQASTAPHRRVPGVRSGASLTRRIVRMRNALATLYRHVVLHDEYAAYRLAEAASRFFYPKYLFSDFGNRWIEDEEFLEYYRRFVACAVDPAGDYRTADRRYFLRSLMGLVRDVHGDFAECGVFLGGSARLMGEALVNSSKTLHLFDSFEGLSEPGPLDDRRYWAAGALAAREEHVRSALEAVAAEFQVHRGWIPERFDAVADRSFSFVHIDVDLHEPTRDCVSFFYPRLSDRGIMLLDDYGFRTTPGATRAVDEYMAQRAEPVITVPTGQAFIVRARR